MSVNLIWHANQFFFQNLPIIWTLKTNDENNRKQQSCVKNNVSLKALKFPTCASRDVRLWRTLCGVWTASLSQADISAQELKLFRFLRVWPDFESILKVTWLWNEKNCIKLLILHSKYDFFIFIILRQCDTSLIFFFLNVKLDLRFVWQNNALLKSLVKEKFFSQNLSQNFVLLTE